MTKYFFFIICKYKLKRKIHKSPSDVWRRMLTENDSRCTLTGLKISLLTNSALDVLGIPKAAKNGQILSEADAKSAGVLRKYEKKIHILIAIQHEKKRRSQCKRLNKLIISLAAGISAQKWYSFMKYNCY